MKSGFWSAVCATTSAIVLLAVVVDDASAQRGGRGGRAGGAGGRDAAGFTRESPAAGGGLAFGSGSPQAKRGDGSAGAPRQGATGTSTENQAQRQEARASAQTSRQQQQSTRQSSRQQQQSAMQSSRQQAAEEYHEDDWDAGKAAAVVATGALVGGATASMAAAAAAPPAPAPMPSQPSQFTAPPMTPPPAPAQACANAVAATVNGVTYSKCGTAWYAEVYGANGPTFVQVAPPPGA